MAPIGGYGAGVAPHRLAGGAAPSRADLSAALNYKSLQSDQQAVIAVIFDIKPGFHAQSHTPSNPQFIAMQVSLDPNPAIQPLPPQYPPGQDVAYPALGRLNVYTGRIMVYVPLQVKANAPPGPLVITGKAVYQICDEQSCYAPERPAFRVETQLVPANQPVEPNQPDLFAGFDPTLFSHAMSPSAPPPFAIAQPITLQLFGWHFALGASAYVWAFVAAFIVGILFNLMPCVLPVVPLKAIGFYEVSRHNRARCFLLGCVFSLGLLCAFAILANLVVVYHTLTWGQQFSNPWFVWSIVAILIVMALGMFGAFTVLLPTAVYRVTPHHDTFTGNFLFGLFTAVLSTPCTAPMFVGLLLWAGQQPQWIGVALVMMVGLGMAFPYLLLSAFPEAARRFPRTGPWAELIKQLMGFLLLAVAVYFAGGRLVADHRFFWAVFVVVAAASLFLIIRTAQFARHPASIVTASLIALLLAGGTLWFTLSLTGAIGSQTHELIPWKPYTPPGAGPSAAIRPDRPGRVHRQLVCQLPGTRGPRLPRPPRRRGFGSAPRRHPPRRPHPR